MRMFKIFLFGMTFAAFTLSAFPQVEQQQYERAMDKLNKTSTKRERFYALGDAAKAAFNIGNMNQARYLIEELQRMLDEFVGDWNFGNAVHDTHIVLGRIALSEGNIAAAKEYLLRAGKTPGSPQLGSFGPNMALAKELLEKGEKDAVLKYFKLCSKFWKKKSSKIPQWTLEVQKGDVPNFGPNLYY